MSQLIPLWIYFTSWKYIYIYINKYIFIAAKCKFPNIPMQSVLSGKIPMLELESVSIIRISLSRFREILSDTFYEFIVEVVPVIA